MNPVSHRIRSGGSVIALLALALVFSGAPTGAENGGEEVALGYYRTLAEGGSADAQLVLGDLYHHGQGVDVDLIEAYAWYYVAAQQGLREALTPMRDVLQALPQSEWPRAKELAEEYASRFAAPR